jgi:glycosyltransferase involved in cell wall biosynthesis
MCAVNSFFPKLSFIIPFHGRYLLCREAIESILLSNSKNIEIILVDDASTDSGLEILLEYIKQFSNITYQRLDIRSGPGVARNYGFKYAKGEWLFFMDSDDVIYSSVLPELLFFLEMDKIADMVFFPSTAHRQSDGTVNVTSFNMSDPKILPLYEIHGDWHSGMLWYFCFRRQFISAYQIEFPNNYPFEDQIFSITALSYVKYFTVFPLVLYEYRMYSENSTMQKRSDLSYWRMERCGQTDYYYTIKKLVQCGIVSHEKKVILEKLLAKYLLYGKIPPPPLFCSAYGL